MYSSLNDSEYQLRRAKAEQEARSAYERTSSVPSDGSERPDTSDGRPETSAKGFLQKLFSRVRDDDLLILGMLLLLFNESAEDDPLILILLAVLLFA